MNSSFVVPAPQLDSNNNGGSTHGQAAAHQRHVHHYHEQAQPHFLRSNASTAAAAAALAAAACLSALPPPGVAVQVADADAVYHHPDLQPFQDSVTYINGSNPEAPTVVRGAGLPGSNNSPTNTFQVDRQHPAGISPRPMPQLGYVHRHPQLSRQHRRREDLLQRASSVRRKHLPHQRQPAIAVPAQHQQQAASAFRVRFDVGSNIRNENSPSNDQFSILASTAILEAGDNVRVRQGAGISLDYLPRIHLSNSMATDDYGSDAVHHTRETLLIDQEPRQEGTVQPPGQQSIEFVVDPPNLQEWRQKLFDLEDIVMMSNEEFETYFPHVDNVYSHRSTQRYKRQPFITHYWDCRMKGRPPGTPKSEDPNKKKRKRQARARDLCDVKIKITEHFDATTLGTADDGNEDFHPASSALAVTAAAAASGSDATGGIATGQRIWTIQRVNGNGTNGIGDGKPAMHKHSLEDSDGIKKNSVQRWLAAREKDVKKAQKPSGWKATGNAAMTVKRHAKDSELKLHASCFCPFSQRVWIALEAKGLAYQYSETDPFRKPKPTHLLEANPWGLVPAIRQGGWACWESSVILEYLEDLDSSVLLLPTNPQLKASGRIWIDFINTKIVPSFYNLLKCTEVEAQNVAIERLQNNIETLVKAAVNDGPFFFGDQICLVDIHVAPFALRMSRILKPLRNWIEARPEARWQRWIKAMEANVHVRNTMSAERLYIDTVDLLIQGMAIRDGMISS